MNNHRLGLDPDNWLNLTDDDAIAPPTRTPIITLGTFLQAVNAWASKANGQWPAPDKAWFTDQGMACEILRTRGGGWQKGRLRFRLEFIPDNPDAFLDESGSDLNPDE